jgi:hypothetical protein
MLLAACGGPRRKYLEQVMPLVEKNDVVDSKVARLPKVNAFKYPDYLEKLDSYIAQKQALRAHMEIVEPPFLMATTHNRLLVAMNNGIRYLQAEREKFIVVAAKMQKMPAWQKGIHGSDEFDIIREYQSQTSAYQVDFREQMMKQQYEKLYGQVKTELARAKGL